MTKLTSFPIRFRHAATLALLLAALPPATFAGTLVQLFADGFEARSVTLAYPQPAYAFDLDQAIAPQAPATSGSPDSFTVQPALPSGLVLDPGTGVISGTPDAPQGPALYRVEASGAAGSAATFLTIEVLDAVCGDAFVAGAEACDDGNLSTGDGCTRSCSVEFGWTCESEGCSLSPAVAAVGLGGFSGCLQLTGGELGCFGRNSRGEVGDGSQGAEVHLPQRVQGIGTTVAVDVGDEHACSLDGVGNVWCWGDNANLQLGTAADGLATSPLPVLVGGLPVADALAAGQEFNCVIDVTGTVRCWGDNDNRQLGRGADTADSATPAAIGMPDGLAAAQLALGGDHACALLSDDTVACWGDDDNGQLGDGAAGIDQGTPARVPAFTDIASIAAGRDTTCAVSATGELSCWGDNVDGQLGIGSTTDQPTPQAVTLPAAVRAVDVGYDFACALLVDDAVHCWGEGTDFRLASGDIVDETSPRAIDGLPPGPWRSIVLGGAAACLLGEDDRRWCWGDGEEGQLGIAPINQLEPSEPQFSTTPDAVVLARPEYRGVICGVMPDDTVECAGDGTLVSTSSITGAQGLFAPLRSHLALPEQRALLADVRHMAIGNGFACVATASDVRCWGDNSQLQLGQGGADTTDLLDPSPVVGLGAIDELATGDQHACVRTGGTVRCWGENSSLQTGQGAGTADQSLPVTVSGLTDATQLALGDNHSCALRAGGVVSCWGDDGQGQLGDGDASSADTAVPVDVVALPGPASQLVSGQNHLCALVAGEVFCWGGANWGNLGQGDQTDSSSAIQVPGLSGITRLASGWNFSCALDGTGEMHCWGYSLDGHLGDGGQEVTGLDRRLSPVRFAVSGGPIEDVVAGNSVTCIQVAGAWRCLGFRHAGQLGDGSTLIPAQPWPMLFSQ